MVMHFLKGLKMCTLYS